MTKRKYIDKHWLAHVLRGFLALCFGGLIFFYQINNRTSVEITNLISYMTIYLLGMGIVDASLALMNSNRETGWLTTIIDSAIDIIAAIVFLTVAGSSDATGVIVLGVYTIVSGIIDLVLAFVSTVDPTDRFIKILIGMLGAIMGFVVLNVGGTDTSADFIRFFGVYLILVGVCSLIYGIHNKSQKAEDTAERSAAAKASAAAKRTAKIPAKSTSAKSAKSAAKSAKSTSKTVKTTKKSSK